MVAMTNELRPEGIFIDLNPIWGGGKFTLSALYRVKSPESRHEVGVMGYQNSSWDICDLTKKVSGPKNF